MNYGDPAYIEQECKCGSHEPINNEGECEMCESIICFYCGNKIKLSESKQIQNGKYICIEHKEDINQE